MKAYNKVTKTVKNTKNPAKKAPQNAAQTSKSAPKALKASEPVMTISNEPMTTICRATIDAIFVPSFTFNKDERNGFDHVRACLSTASSLKLALSRVRNEIEALERVGSKIKLGLNDQGVFFSQDVDKGSKALFPESCVLLSWHEAGLARDMERMNRALKIERVLAELSNARCMYSGLSERNVPIVELVQKTGLSYEDVVEAIHNLEAAKDSRADDPHEYRLPARSSSSHLEAV